MRMPSAFALSFFLVAAPLAADTTMLFRQLPDAAEKAVTRVKAKRSAAISPDVEALKVRGFARGTRMKMERRYLANLFPDVLLPVRLDRLEVDLVGSWVWSGNVEGDAGSAATISVNGDAMHAVFFTAGRQYTVTTAPGGTHQASEIDASAFPGEVGPIAVGTTGHALPLTANAVDATAAASDAAGTWDILVAYTNIVRAAPEYGSQAAVQAMISNAIATTNTSYQNSGVTSRMRLVGTMEVDYDDRTTDFSTTLTRLRNTGTDTSTRSPRSALLLVPTR